MTNKEAIKRIQEHMIIHKMNEPKAIYISEALNMTIKALEQADVLEKIRAEILDEAEYAYADFDRYKEDILHADSDELPDDDFRYGLERAVEIINKYREVDAE